MVVDKTAGALAQEAFAAFVAGCAGDPELVQEVEYYKGIPVHGGCFDPTHIIPALVQSLSDVNPWELERIVAAYPLLAQTNPGADLEECQTALLVALNRCAPPGFRFSAHPRYPDLIGWFSELLYLDPHAVNA